MDIRTKIQSVVERAAAEPVSLVGAGEVGE